MLVLFNYTQQLLGKWIILIALFQRLHASHISPAVGSYIQGSSTAGRKPRWRSRIRHQHYLALDGINQFRFLPTPVPSVVFVRDPADLTIAGVLVGVQSAGSNPSQCRSHNMFTPAFIVVRTGTAHRSTTGIKLKTDTIGSDFTAFHFRVNGRSCTRSVTAPGGSNLLPG